MFDHPRFDKYSFEEIPLNRDLYLMDEIWLDEYEKSLVTMFEGGDYESVGYISCTENQGFPYSWPMRTPVDTDDWHRLQSCQTPVCQTTLGPGDHMVARLCTIGIPE